MDDLVKRLREKAGAFDYDGRPDIACDYEQAADAIAELTAPKWISVTKRLPKKDGWYQVYAPSYSGGSSTGLKCIDGRVYSKFERGKWSIERGYYRRPGCVTHWMPLPEPPKEEAT